MNKKTWKMLLNIIHLGLGAAGLVLILLSLFTEHDVLKWGMLCVALGSILTIARMHWQKKSS